MVNLTKIAPLSRVCEHNARITYCANIPIWDMVTWQSGISFEISTDDLGLNGIDMIVQKGRQEGLCVQVHKFKDRCVFYTQDLPVYSLKACGIDSKIFLKWVRLKDLLDISLVNRKVLMKTLEMAVKDKKLICRTAAPYERGGRPTTEYKKAGVDND